METSADFFKTFYNQTHDIDVLEKNVEEYPFSSLTRFLLLCHYKKLESPDFETAAQKTAVYFNNHHWLGFQLSQVKVHEPGNKLQEESIVAPDVNDENGHENHFAVMTGDGFNDTQTNEVIISPNEEVIPDTENVHQYNETLMGDSYSADENTIPMIDEVAPETQTLGSHVHFFEERSIANDYENDKHIISEKQSSIPETQTLGSYIEGLESSSPPGNYEENEYAPDEHRVPETETLGSNEHELGDTRDALPASAENAEVAARAVGEPVAFEPMHTVDYFASQGIRIPDEALSNDKLGTQMKSFTEWLKSMKKIHPGKLSEENSLAEDIVKSAAEVSNIDTEVLTEAMAEVLIKQDKKEKAIEMYNKLSLINPSKSAYFAAKIESIKST